MIGSFWRALRKRAALCSLGVLGICLLIAGCSETFRQIAIPLPTQTGDPAPLDRALFLATAGSGPGSVTMVDVPGDTNVGVEQVGAGPVMIGLTFGGGRAVVPNATDNSASSFQTGVTFGSVNTTTLPAGAGATFAHSRQNARIYLALTALNELGVVDSTLAVVNQVPLPGCSSPVGISQVPGGGNIYVACSGGNVALVTGSDNVVIATIPDAGSPRWIDSSADGNFMFVANQGTSSVDVICSSTNVVICNSGNTVMTSVPVAGAPNFLKYDPHSQHVFVAGAGFVSVIDASGSAPTFADIKDIPASGQTWVTPLRDGSRFYVSDAGARTVTSYNATNFAPIKTINLADPATPISTPSTTTPIMIDSDKNSTKVYTANTGSNDFTIIRTLDDTEAFPGTVVSGQPTRLKPPAGQVPVWVTALP
jgi:DNA-binding beta-propeller fold protein YncE